ncbi:unnamed protein product [Trichogramma brassicae]|uniref:Uncharacterized protein n=1 Tax=Trichogramma brassicae TaxID=86971 RepID=A0A6H5HXD9_9HYME|nr:unnamed protein product [Trichogramma brassicae]
MYSARDQTMRKQQRLDCKRERHINLVATRRARLGQYREVRGPRADCAVEKGSPTMPHKLLRGLALHHGPQSVQACPTLSDYTLCKLRKLQVRAYGFRLTRVKSRFTYLCIRSLHAHVLHGLKRPTLTIFLFCSFNFFTKRRTIKTTTPACERYDEQRRRIRTHEGATLCSELHVKRVPPRLPPGNNLHVANQGCAVNRNYFWGPLPTRVRIIQQAEVYTFDAEDKPDCRMEPQSRFICVVRRVPFVATSCCCRPTLYEDCSWRSVLSRIIPARTFPMPVLVVTRRYWEPEQGRLSVLFANRLRPISEPHRPSTNGLHSNRIKRRSA